MHTTNPMAQADQAEIAAAAARQRDAFNAAATSAERDYLLLALKTKGQGVQASGREQPAALAIIEELAFRPSCTPEVRALVDLFWSVARQRNDIAIAEAARHFVRTGMAMMVVMNIQDRADGVAPRVSFVPGVRHG
ncbi:hypothetical protein [Pigmentiphaga sp. CHJ604]|uniref:hypothetical protein n=1 Tax=Pigmentiphaga sp. CHJ604 TaxID=3081984 RepID=UPI0030CD4648